MYQCKEPDVVFQEWSTFLPFKHNDRQVLYFYLYHNTDKHLRKPKGQSRMNNPEKLATLGMQTNKTNKKHNTEKEKDEQHRPQKKRGRTFDFSCCVHELYYTYRVVFNVVKHRYIYHTYIKL
jgi:hypothetical protein